MHRQASDFTRAWFLIEHRVKTVEDLRILRYISDGSHYEMDTADYEAQYAAVGDDGIVLATMPCVPYIEFARTDVGYAHAFYLMADYPGEVEPFLEAYQQKILEAFRLAAQGPCELLTTGDNMDQLTCPPAYFTRYAVPFYREIGAILHAGGRIVQGHWCGQLDQLLPLIPGCGLDVVEAMTPMPMSKVDMRRAMALLEGKIAVQGGIPSIFMCESG